MPRAGHDRGMSEFASTYDALAPRWDGWAGSVTPDPRLEWSRKLDAFLEPGEQVVELGCGTGSPVGRDLAARFGYTGVDASPGMLARARQQVPGAQFLHCAMEDATFAPGSLGGVVAFHSIGHVPRDRHAALFAAVAHWLRPGGAFVAVVHSRDDEAGYEPDWLGAG